MEFKFGKYTEITDFAFEVNPQYKNDGYVRFFICPDVWDFWFIRILKGYSYNDEEGYIKDKDSFILERNKIEMDKKAENLSIIKVKKIITDDDGSNWDIEQSDNIEDLIQMIDGGFGILNLQENK